MAISIPPQSSINTVVLVSVTIQYAPTWDGAAWVVDPAGITSQAIGYATNDGENISRSSALVPFNDLTVAAQSAVQALADSMEQEMADNYT